MLQVPCGKCDGCLLDRSKKWAIRCKHEASLHPKNCFITLTCDDYHPSPDGSLNTEDFQLFMKRLRKKFGSGICFFHSGEYGSLYMRPHHHAIIFGMDFNDKELISRGSSSRFYYSSTLATLWPFGFSSIGQVTEQSCAYVARYVLKKVNGKEAKSYYGHLKPEYITMSRKPGIAHDWILQYKDDVYPHDYVVLSKGIKARPSAYYDKIYDLMDNNSLQLIKNNRIEQIKNNSDYDNPERLAVKEKVQQLRTKKLVRNLEQVL